MFVARSAGVMIGMVGGIGGLGIGFSGIGESTNEPYCSPTEIFAV
jgi:hypothetical protein